MERMGKPTFDFDQPLTDDDGEVDPDALVDYASELVALFLETPGGERFDDDDLDAVEGTISELVERALREHGLRLHQLTAPVLERIVFEGLPAGWHHPAEAGPMLEALAAFMRFLGGLGLAAAPGCVALLEGEGAEQRLADAFRAKNRTCPDPELALFLREASDEDGEDEGEPSSSAPPGRSREEQRKEKDKKKAAKKAKRRNR